MTLRHAVGDRVDGLYDGNSDDVWYPAAIIAANAADETYDVLYDDGEAERHVQSKFLRVHREGTICVGSRVFGRYAGGDEWYPGRIHEVEDDGAFTIAYDDGEVETRVPFALICETPSGSLNAKPRGDEERVREVEAPAAAPPVQEAPHEEVSLADCEPTEAEEAILVNAGQKEAGETQQAPVVDADQGLIPVPELVEEVPQHDSTTRRNLRLRSSSQSVAEEEAYPAVAAAAVEQHADGEQEQVEDDYSKILFTMERLESCATDALATKTLLSTLVKQMRAFPQATADLVHSRGGEALLMDILRAHHTHAVIQCYGFVLLRRLCFLCGKSTHFFLRNGIIELIAIAMRKFPEDAILQASACGALAVFTRVHTGLAMLLENRVAHLVLATIIFHKAYSVHTRQVHYYACEVLLELCELGDKTTIEALCGDGISGPGLSDLSPLSLLLFLLRQALSFDDKKASCAAGTLLMCLASCHRHAAQMVLELNGLSELSTVMATYPMEPGIQKYAASASKEIALCSMDQQQYASSPHRRLQQNLLGKSESMEDLQQQRLSHQHRKSEAKSKKAMSRREKGKALPSQCGGVSALNGFPSPTRRQQLESIAANPRDALSFSKFSSPIGKAPHLPPNLRFAADATSAPSPSGAAYHQQMQHQQMGNALVILDGHTMASERKKFVKAEKHNLLFETYGVDAKTALQPTSHQRSQGIKRRQLKTHLIPASTATDDPHGIQWASPVKSIILKDLKPLSSRSDKHSAKSSTEVTRIVRSSGGNSERLTEDQSPSTLRRQQAHPTAKQGKSTPRDIREKTPRNSFKLKLDRTPSPSGMTSPIALSPKTGVTSSRSNSTAKSKTTHATTTSRAPALPSNVSTESLNSYAAQLFRDEMASSETTTVANAQERERLSFAEKLHKMIDKAKSSLAHVTTTPLTPDAQSPPVKTAKRPEPVKSAGNTSAKKKPTVAPPVATSRAAPATHVRSKNAVSATAQAAPTVVNTPAAVKKAAAAAKSVRSTVTRPVPTTTAARDFGGTATNPKPTKPTPTSKPMPFKAALQVPTTVEVPAVAASVAAATTVAAAVPTSDPTSESANSAMNSTEPPSNGVAVPTTESSSAIEETPTVASEQEDKESTTTTDAVIPSTSVEEPATATHDQVASDVETVTPVECDTPAATEPVVLTQSTEEPNDCGPNDCGPNDCGSDEPAKDEEAAKEAAAVEEAAAVASSAADDLYADEYNDFDDLDNTPQTLDDDTIDTAGELSRGVSFEALMDLTAQMTEFTAASEPASDIPAIQNDETVGLDPLQPEETTGNEIEQIHSLIASHTDEAVVSSGALETDQAADATTELQSEDAPTSTGGAVDCQENSPAVSIISHEKAPGDEPPSAAVDNGDNSGEAAAIAHDDAEEPAVASEDVDSPSAVEAATSAAESEPIQDEQLAETDETETVGAASDQKEEALAPEAEVNPEDETNDDRAARPADCDRPESRQTDMSFADEDFDDSPDDEGDQAMLEEAESSETPSQMDAFAPVTVESVDAAEDDGSTAQPEAPIDEPNSPVENSLVETEPVSSTNLDVDANTAEVPHEKNADYAEASIASDGAVATATCVHVDTEEDSLHLQGRSDEAEGSFSANDADHAPPPAGEESELASPEVVEVANVLEEKIGDLSVPSTAEEPTEAVHGEENSTSIESKISVAEQNAELETELPEQVEESSSMGGADTEIVHRDATEERIATPHNYGGTAFDSDNIQSDEKESAKGVAARQDDPPTDPQTGVTASEHQITAAAVSSEEPVEQPSDDNPASDPATEAQIEADSEQATANTVESARSTNPDAYEDDSQFEAEPMQPMVDADMAVDGTSNGSAQDTEETFDANQGFHGEEPTPMPAESPKGEQDATPVEVSVDAPPTAADEVVTSEPSVDLELTVDSNNSEEVAKPERLTVADNEAVPGVSGASALSSSDAVKLISSAGETITSTGEENTGAIEEETSNLVPSSRDIDEANGGHEEQMPNEVKVASIKTSRPTTADVYEDAFDGEFPRDEVLKTQKANESVARSEDQLLSSSEAEVTVDTQSVVEKDRELGSGDVAGDVVERPATADDAYGEDAEFEDDMALKTPPVELEAAHLTDAGGDDATTSAEEQQEREPADDLSPPVHDESPSSDDTPLDSSSVEQRPATPDAGYSYDDDVDHHDNEDKTNPVEHAGSVEQQPVAGDAGSVQAACPVDGSPLLAADFVVPSPEDNDTERTTTPAEVTESDHGETETAEVVASVGEKLDGSASPVEDAIAVSETQTSIGEENVFAPEERDENSTLAAPEPLVEAAEPSSEYAEGDFDEGLGDDAARIEPSPLSKSSELKELVAERASDPVGNLTVETHAAYEAVDLAQPAVEDAATDVETAAAEHVTESTDTTIRSTATVQTPTKAPAEETDAPSPARPTEAQQLIGAENEVEAEEITLAEPSSGEATATNAVVEQESTEPPIPVADSSLLKAEPTGSVAQDLTEDSAADKGAKPETDSIDVPDEPAPVKRGVSVAADDDVISASTSYAEVELATSIDVDSDSAELEPMKVAELETTENVNTEITFPVEPAADEALQPAQTMDSAPADVESEPMGDGVASAEREADATPEQPPETVSTREPAVEPVEPIVEALVKAPTTHETETPYPLDAAGGHTTPETPTKERAAGGEEANQAAEVETAEAEELPTSNPELLEATTPVAESEQPAESRELSINATAENDLSVKYEDDDPVLAKAEEAEIVAPTTAASVTEADEDEPRYKDHENEFAEVGSSPSVIQAALPTMEVAPPPSSDDAEYDDFESEEATPRVEPPTPAKAANDEVAEETAYDDDDAYNDFEDDETPVTPSVAAAVPAQHKAAAEQVELEDAYEMEQETVDAAANKPPPRIPSPTTAAEEGGEYDDYDDFEE